MKTYLKIKVVSLAAEAKLIRHEELRIKCRKKRSEKAITTWAGLRNHRVNVVRPEARAACLAYAFMRGRQYKQVEAKAYEKPNWSRVEQLVSRYCEGDRREVMQRFSEWKSVA